MSGDPTIGVLTAAILGLALVLTIFVAGIVI